MPQPLFATFVEADALASQLNNPRLQTIDMSAPERYSESHIAGAAHLDYTQIIRQQPPILGLLPNFKQLQTLFSNIGLRNDAHIVVYDAEGSGKAARLLWTLAACGFNNISILNGGRSAWQAGNYPMESACNPWPASHFKLTPNPEVIADKAYILSHLNDPKITLLDARSPAEYCGDDLRAARGGHIPGAKNLDWSLTFNSQHDLRLKSATVLEALMTERRIYRENEIIVHCQSHHRSALMYAILKFLGYPRVRGYHGSWSEWGNCNDTPIEV
ncbi:MAG: sulfurtransferase [Gammaproteobacteria bacterium]|nr:sulfurtransferase [Gammaproteobacteria bacterium]MCF6231204.1 sulfurtransferase [Gammaproteobacteria bacterium]